MKKYFEDLKNKVDEEYKVANLAKAKGLDPVDNVEIPLAMTMAEKSVSLIKTIYLNLSTKKISNRILELEKQYGQLDTTVSFVIAREIAEEKFCKFKNKIEAIDAGIRVGFAYITLGVVASPIEGYTGLKLGKTRNGKDYFIVSFSGPIRSAGTTSVCLVLMLIDYLRECFGYAKYDASEEEIKRYVIENTDFHERISNLQYFPTEEEMEFLASHLPIQIDGDPTSKREVSNYKDLARVETNFIRGGMCLTFSEGLAQKAGKALGRLKSCKDNGLKCSGFDWLNDYLTLHKKREYGDDKIIATYIKDLVAGRPVYGHPSRSGGFRFRYGRSRTAGFSAVSIHPATMGISNGFLSHGTQLKIERPTKGCVITSCDSIDGPIVKLKDGSVKKLNDFEEAKRLYKDVDEIIYLGDILFPLGDVIDRNADLVKPGYVEEWWRAELEETVSSNAPNGHDPAGPELGAPSQIQNKNWLGQTLPSHIQNKNWLGQTLSSREGDYKLKTTNYKPRGGLQTKNREDISLDKAMELSGKFGVALHPKFIFYWTQISNEDFNNLIKWMNGAVWRSGKLVLPWESLVREKFGKAKRALEILGVEHSVVMDNVVIDGDAKTLLVNLGIKEMYNGEVLKIKVDEVPLHIQNKYPHKYKGNTLTNKKEKQVGADPSGWGRPNRLGQSLDERSVLKFVNERCEFKIKDKAGSFIGARMGRPEKAKLRNLVGSPNVLFPVSDQGGRLRSIQEAVKVGFIKADYPIYRCECGNETIYPTCEKCGARTKKFYFCRECHEVKKECCKLHKSCFKFSNRRIDSRHFFEDAVRRLGFKDFEVPPLVKGINKTNSGDRDVENLAKGILRAKFNLSVNKDGTIRYDGTEIPLTHFKPFEIRVSVEKLRVLGYDKDVDGKDLIEDSQILELKPHDVVLPSCPETKDEKADDVFFSIANFIDEELEKFYKLPKFYNLKNKGDLVGQLIVCMAPHNCAGVVGRIIGFSKMQGILASPYMHAAVRRDCDGDEMAVMMLMDVLINFSRKFLPSHRGGSQDAPLILNARIRAGEVDDQILSFETCSSYPLELYKLAERGGHSSEVRSEEFGIGNLGFKGTRNGKRGIELIGDRLRRGAEPFVGMGWTHDTSDINLGNTNGAYKILPTMKEKVDGQMELVKKIRAVDTDDVARLILERHFIRDICGNLRKFGKQKFRCANCNEKFRRPPLKGSCLKCGGKIIFTISEGSIKKYLKPAMKLAEEYNISSYTREELELTQDYIESIFGKEEQLCL